MTGIAEVVAALNAVPLIAILRGVTTDEAPAVAEVLIDAGFRCIEVPLNSPDPFETIALLQAQFGDRAIFGAGTVTDCTQVERLAATGAALCVSPHADGEVIDTALRHRLVPIPGFQTATEAFAAIRAGARILKFFPAAGRERDLSALRAVLPSDVVVVAVGGALPEDVDRYRTHGADGFGIGSDLYKPGRDLADLAQRAQRWVNAVAETNC